MTLFRFTFEGSFHADDVIDTEALENVTFANVPCVVFRRETLVIFSQPRIRHCEYLAEKVWILYLRDTGGLTVCQCQRDKKKKNKAANEGVGPVFGYQAILFYFYSRGRQNAKLSQLDVWQKIFSRLRERKSMNFVNRIYRAPDTIHILFKQFFLYGAQVPYVKSKYSLIDRRLSWPGEVLSLARMCRLLPVFGVFNGPSVHPDLRCSSFSRATKLPLLARGEDKRWKENRERETDSALRVFSRVVFLRFRRSFRRKSRQSRPSRFRLRVCTIVVISTVSRTWLHGKIVVSARQSREKKRLKMQPSRHVRSGSWLNVISRVYRE